MKCCLEIQQGLQAVAGWKNRCVTRQDLAKAAARLQDLGPWKGRSSRECWTKLQKHGSSIQLQDPSTALEEALWGNVWAGACWTHSTGPAALVLHSLPHRECRCRLTRLAKENWSLAPAGGMGNRDLDPAKVPFF